jgi:hypothetical protein
LMKSMPETDARLKAAREIVRRFAVAPQESTEATEVVRKRIAHAAQECGFVVNSLSVERKDPRVAPGAGSPSSAVAAFPAGDTVLVSVGGEGPLSSLIRFLNQVQGPACLVTVESAAVRTMNMVTEPMYTGDFTLRYYLVTL